MPIRSPHPDVHVPDVPLHEAVLAGAAAFGDRPALVDGATGRAIAYAELPALVDAFAGALAARGIGKGDVVAIHAPNLPEYAIAYYGVLRAGATTSTANALSTAEELARQLAATRARLLVTCAALLPTALEAAASAGVRSLVSIGGGDGAADLADLLAECAPAPDVALDPAVDLAALPSSSGTTGLPKSVMLTHRNLVANVVQFAAVRPYRDGAECTVAVLPFFHIYGQTVVLNLGLRAGATIVTLARFDMERYLQLSEEHRATIAYVAPPLVLGLAKSPLVDRFDLSSLVEMMSGAAPLDAALARACGERLGCRVAQGYGMTEASPVTNAVPIGVPDRPGSIGPLLPNVEARIVDLDSGEEVPAGARGELWVRGPNVMPGYLDDPRATDATLVDGWLRTGDIAVADGDGWLTIVDRAKELIKVSGYQVAPAELEALLVEHPAVLDACVIGVPDAERGEVPKAFVALRDPVGVDELLAFVAGRVAPYKRVRVLEVVDEIPKSASGKILRRVLAARERQAAGPS